jgi:PTS system nitrogen regulatory IIA component
MYLRIQDAAEIFDVPEQTIERWIDKEGLPTTRVRGEYRFQRSELLEWAAEKRVPFSRMEEEHGGASLAAALEAGGVHHGVPGTEKQAVLRAIVERLPDVPGMTKEELLGVLVAREELGSTAVGDGIAIPHVRRPVVLRGVRALVMLSFLEAPIVFDAAGSKVSTLFTLVTPTVHTHLSLLARIAKIAHDPRVRALLASRSAKEELLSAIRSAEGGGA